MGDERFRGLQLEVEDEAAVAGVHAGGRAVRAHGKGGPVLHVDTEWLSARARETGGPAAQALGRNVTLAGHVGHGEVGEVDLVRGEARFGRRAG